MPALRTRSSSIVGPRLVCSAPREAPEARQQTNRMSDQSLHFMTKHFSKSWAHSNSADCRDQCPGAGLSLMTRQDRGRVQPTRPLANGTRRSLVRATLSLFLWTLVLTPAFSSQG